MNDPVENYELGFWNATPFLEAASILVAADEPLRALQLLELLPGVYRDHMPLAILTMKQEILCKLSTASSYANDVIEDLPDPSTFYDSEDPRNTVRFKFIKKDVEAFNLKGITPHIFDLGPGNYWLPVCLRSLGLKFTYQDVGLSKSLQSKIAEFLGDDYRKEKPKAPVIFVACELIEHLHHEEDILAECLRHGVSPEIIHMSTPKYTFDPRAVRINWHSFGDLGHLRTYTPSEFYRLVSKMFPFHQMECFDSKILHVRGIKKSLHQESSVTI